MISCNAYKIEQAEETNEDFEEERKSENFNKKMKDLAERLQIPIIYHAKIDSQCFGRVNYILKGLTKPSF